MTRQLALEKAFTHDYLNELSAEEASAGITGARWKENFTERPSRGDLGGIQSRSQDDARGSKLVGGCRER